MKRILLLLIIYMTVLTVARAQFHGQVVDAADGYGIPYATLTAADGHHSSVCDGDGFFTLSDSISGVVKVTAVGYGELTLKVSQLQPDMKIELKASVQHLKEVTIKAHRRRYHRNGNPAVELMRRVIAAKKHTELTNYDYYQYVKYQKLTFADSQPDSMKHGHQQWWRNQLEVSPYNGKTVLPFIVNETLTRHLYRKDPHKERDIVLAERSDGVNKLLETGDIFNTLLKEVFTDVNIYDDYIRLVQYPFPSPIGRTAISFYHFHIEDTVRVENDSCIHLRFYPANQQDFGFTGDLYVMKDSSLQVRECTLNIPVKSDVNFIKGMRIDQCFTRLPDGQWGLTHDDLWAQLSFGHIIHNMLVTRNTRLADYSFAPIDRKKLRGKAVTVTDPDAQIHDDDYWSSRRMVPLTHGEARMDDFVKDVERSKGFFVLKTLSQIFLENFLETGSKSQKSLFDFGPLNTILSHNFVDGWRTQISGRTTAALNPHLFWKGFAGYGFGSHHGYYSSQFTWSLNKKERSPFEFPQRNIIFESEKDVMSPSDKYLFNNKNNVFMSIRTQKVDQMYFYHRQRLLFDYETDWGLAFHAGLQAESDRPTGSLHFLPVDGRSEVRQIRTTELKSDIFWCPNETFVNTKQRRMPVNYDNPEFELSHTMGLKHFLGGQFRTNLTQLRLYKRQWLGSWGALEMNLNAGAEWNRAPFPLLIMPPVNVSYFMERDNELFSMMRNMEFINDRYVFWNLSWDMNGKLLNRIPLLQHLKWREFFAVKGMWGHLTDKNNPELHPESNLLYRLPENTCVMSNKPYWEMVVGVHNIFKFFAVNYVRRLSYLDHAHTHRNGIRFSFLASF